MKRTIKPILIAATIFISGYARGQNTNLTADIKGLSKEVTIMYTNGTEKKSDKISPAEGKFSWTAPMPQAQKITIIFPGRVKWIYAEAGNMTMSGSTAELGDLKITGSKTQAELEAYNKGLQEFLEKEKQASGTTAPEEPYTRERNLRIKKNRFEKKYIKDNPESLISLNLLIDRSGMGTYEELNDDFTMLGNKIKNSVEGKTLKERIAVLKRKTSGQTVLDFTLNDLEGKPLNISQYKGQYVFIDFWASWCHPCRAEMPNVRKAYEKYKEKGFSVLGLSIDENDESWKKAVQQDGMPWPQIIDLKDRSKSVSGYYGIQGIPSNLLVDPNGKIIAIDLRGDMLHQKLAEVFTSK